MPPPASEAAAGAQLNIKKADYKSKKGPVQLTCECCGVRKPCIPCKQSRWCKRGRCPVCFPTMLSLADTGKVSSHEKQRQLHLRLWDVEFVCEACASNGGDKPPLLTNVLEKQEDQLATPLEGVSGYYLTRDNNLIDEREYQALKQQRNQQQPQQQQQAQARPAQPSQQQQQRQQPQQQQRPGSAGQQQQQRKPAQQDPQAKPKKAAAAAGRSSPPPPAAAAAAGGGAGAGEAEPARKRLKPNSAAAGGGGGGGGAAAATRPLSAQQAAAERLFGAGNNNNNSDRTGSLQRSLSLSDGLPGQAPKAGAAAGKAGAARAAAAAAAAGGGGGGQAPAAKKPRSSPPPAAAAAAGGAQRKQAAAKAPPSAAGAGTAAARKQALPAGGGGRDSEEGEDSGDTSSEGVPLTKLPAMVNKKAEAAAAADKQQQGSWLKSVSSLKQQQQQKEPADKGKAAGQQQQQQQRQKQQQQQGGAAPLRPGQAAGARNNNAAAVGAAGKAQQPAAAGKAQKPAGGAGAGSSVVIRSEGRIKRKHDAKAAPHTDSEESDSSSSSEEGDEDEAGSGSEEEEEEQDDPEKQAVEEQLFGSREPAAAGGGGAGNAAAGKGGGGLRKQASGIGKAPGSNLAAAAAAARNKAGQAAGAAAGASAGAKSKKKPFSIDTTLKGLKGAGNDSDSSPEGDLSAALRASQAQAASKDAAAAAAAAAANAEAARAAARQREAAGQPLGNVWPIKCQVEAMTTIARYEFRARVKEAPGRVGVQVPPLLDQMRDRTLRCMFCNRETMLSCMDATSSQLSQHYRGAGQQYEAVFDAPAPLRMTEFALQNAQLPAVVRWMKEQKLYMRVVGGDSGSSLFFGPVQRSSGHVVDYGAGAPLQHGAAAAAAASEFVTLSDELGLVMFKDVLAAEPPAAYGKLIGQLEEQGSLTPRAAAAAAGGRSSSSSRHFAAFGPLQDESWLLDLNLDNYYDQELIDAALQQRSAAGAAGVGAAAAAHIGGGGGGASGAMGAAAAAGGGGAAGFFSQLQQRQQQQNALAAGMGRDLLPRPGAARAGARSSAIPRATATGRLAAAQQVAAAAAGGGVNGSKPSEGVAGAAAAKGGLQQRQQSGSDGGDGNGDAMHIDNAGEANPAAAAAANGGALPPAQQQQQPGQQQGQQQAVGPNLSPLARLLAGGQPAGPLMPTPQHVLHVVRQQGLRGLVVYLDELSFSDYRDPTKLAGEQTRKYVRQIRQRGVTVYAPGDPPQRPPPETVHVVMVSNANMTKCGLEVTQNPVHATEFLVSGALVVSEHFIAHLLDLPYTGPGPGGLQLDMQSVAGARLLQHMSQSYHRTGIVLLLDSSLLLAEPAARIAAMLQQLQTVKQLVAARASAAAAAAAAAAAVVAGGGGGGGGGDGAAAAADAQPLTAAYVRQVDLQAAALQHLRADYKWSTYFDSIGQVQGLCALWKEELTSKKLEPPLTIVLRNAHKVAFNFNKSQVSNIGPDKDKAPPVLPLRYTIVAAPDNTSCLSRERQAAVQELLSNTDESHKAVFGATLSQTSHFLACVEQQLSAEQQQQ